MQLKRFAGRSRSPLRRPLLAQPIEQCSSPGQREVHAPRVPARGRMHESGDRSLAASSHEQVNVIGHQDVRVESRITGEACVPKVPQEYLPELVAKEARIAIVATQDDVLWKAGNVDSRWSWHLQ